MRIELNLEVVNVIVIFQNCIIIVEVIFTSLFFVFLKTRCTPLSTFPYYFILQGERNSEDPNWPRIVREILVRRRHAICRLCTARGKLEETIVTASKHGK